MATNDDSAPRSSFLTRLRKDQRGNTIAMVGAALIPLTVMIGSGVDASRAYMVKTRLQQACDAGVLAGRKAVSGSTYSTTAQARASAFFNNNFPSGYQSTTGTTFTSSSPDGGRTVNGVARTTLPTAIMGLLSPQAGDTAAEKAAKARVQANEASKQTRNVTYEEVSVPIYEYIEDERTKTEMIAGTETKRVPIYETIPAGAKTIRVPVYTYEKVATGKQPTRTIPVYKMVQKTRDKTANVAAVRTVEVPTYRVTTTYGNDGKPIVKRERTGTKTVQQNTAEVAGVKNLGTRTYVAREIVGYETVVQPDYVMRKVATSYREIERPVGATRTLVGYKEVTQPSTTVERVDTLGVRKVMKRELVGYETRKKPVITEAAGTAAPILNKQSIALTVNCAASFTISNSDITLVLDTTGSMACPNTADTAACSTYFANNGAVEGVGGTTSRLSALKTSVANFHNTISTSAAGSTARVRYAIVPYAFTVNTGELLYDTNRDWILGGNAGESWTYQSRRAVYDYEYWTAPVAAGTEQLQYVTTSQCSSNFAGNNNTTWRNNSNNTNRTWTPTSSGFGYNYSGTGQNVTRTGNANVRYTFSFNYWGTPNKSSDSNYRTCRRNVFSSTRIAGETTDPNATGVTGFSHYEYLPVTFPVSDYVNSIKTSNAAVRIPSNEASVTTTSRWGGCIEERATTAALTFAYSSTTDRITPTSATDMNIDAAPTDAASKWRPYYADVTYYRTSGGNYTDSTTTSGTKSQIACSYKAKLLSTMTSAQMTSYLANLTPTGGTHHDIGALWGARLSSPTGIFASNVTETPTNGGFVSRHMIFFTDGQLDTGPSGYSSYGIEIHDKRVTGNGSDNQDNRHISRFRAICDAIKAKGIRIWVITLGTSVDSNLAYCASTDSSFLSTNQTTLNANFQQIASSIADLRLTQ